MITLKEALLSPDPSFMRVANSIGVELSEVIDVIKQMLKAKNNAGESHGEINFASLGRGYELYYQTKRNYITQEAEYEFWFSYGFRHRRDFYSKRFDIETLANILMNKVSQEYLDKYKPIHIRGNEHESYQDIINLYPDLLESLKSEYIDEYNALTKNVRQMAIDLLERLSKHFDVNDKEVREVSKMATQAHRAQRLLKENAILNYFNKINPEL